jgi:hypothetical protein
LSSFYLSVLSTRTTDPLFKNPKTIIKEGRSKKQLAIFVAKRLHGQKMLSSRRRQKAGVKPDATIWHSLCVMEMNAGIAVSRKHDPVPVRSLRAPTQTAMLRYKRYLKVIG